MDSPLKVLYMSPVRLIFHSGSDNFTFNKVGNISSYRI